MERIALYTGSFDPLTLGHWNILVAATQMCDHLIIGIGRNASKTPMFSEEERIEMIRETWNEQPVDGTCRLYVEPFSGLAIQAAAQWGVQFLIRGLRNGTDFDYEMSMAGMNAAMAPQVKTIFLPTSPVYSHVNATLVRQISQMGGDYSSFVPAAVARRIAAKTAPPEQETMDQ